MWPWLGTLLAWAVAGWWAAALGWRVWGQVQPVLDGPQGLVPVAAVTEVDAMRMASALGSGRVATGGDAPAPTAPTPVASAGTWRVLGVVADTRGRGAALLARDGDPPRAYRVGAALPGGGRVERVERDAVWLASGDGTPAVRLAVPPRTPSPR